MLAKRFVSAENRGGFRFEKKREKCTTLWSPFYFCHCQKISDQFETRPHVLLFLRPSQKSELTSSPSGSCKSATIVVKVHGAQKVEHGE